MKLLPTLATALSLALLIPVVSNHLAPAAIAQDDVYWDAKLLPGTDPYELTGNKLDGKPVSLADYKGKVVLLDFWATWCGPCVAEIPNVKANYEKYHDKGVEVLGISLDRDKAPLNKFIETRKIPWSQVYDADQGKEGNATRYGVQAIPFVLLIGKDGKIAAVNPRGEALEPAIKAALAK
jgi:peroxiredoxin